MDRAYFTELRGVYLSQSGRYSEAGALLSQAIATYLGHGQPLQAIAAYDHLVDHYERAGRYRSALTSLRDREQLQDSLDQLSNDRLLRTLEARLELAERQRHIEELEWQRRLWQWGGLLTLATAALFLYLYYRKQRLNRALDRQNALLDERNRDIARMAEARDRLYVNLSHELRTPLTLMVTPVHQLLESDDLTDTQRRQLSEVVTAGASLDRATTELIDFSKLDHGLLSVTPEPCQVNTWAEQLLGSFAWAAEDQGIELTYTSELPPETVLALDRSKVATIITNLLSNALKYAEAATQIQLQVGAAAGAIEFRITDNGPGIDPLTKDRIFERFFRGVQVNGSNGSGIGLAFARELAELMGGTLSLTDGTDGGSQFTLRLPREEIAPAAAPTELAAEEDRAAKRRILIAEDHPALQRLIAESLTDLGSVTVVADGQEAWELLQQTEGEGYDLLVTDLMMPRLDGFELLERLSKLPPSRVPACVVLTARRDEAVKMKVLRTGVSDYMTKPFLPAELRARATTLLGYRRVRAGGPEHGEQKSADTEFALRLREVVMQDLGRADLSADDIAGQLYLSRRGLYRKLKEEMGMTPGEYLRELRLERACSLLEDRPDIPLKELAAEVGFKTANYFSKLFRTRFGCHPHEWARR
jgi:signal transduction histidine kinase/DNA-binding response OmpR family regulator